MATLVRRAFHSRGALGDAAAKAICIEGCRRGGGHSCVAVAAYVKPLSFLPLPSRQANTTILRVRRCQPFLSHHLCGRVRQQCASICDMAIAERATQVPDSEDELFTSSPEVLPDGTIGQLDGTAEERPRDASSRAGGLDPLEETAAEHTANPRGDEQTTASADVRSPDSVARANQQYPNKLQVSHQHASSLTDTCDSSNQLSSVPTNSSSLHVFNGQKHTAETEPASRGDGKEPIIPDEESVLSPVVETANAASSRSGPNHQPPTTDGKLLNHSEHPIDSAYSEIAPPRNNSLDPPDTKDRDCSCPPSFSPTGLASSSNGHALRRSTTTDGASLTKQKIQYEVRKDTRPPEVSSSIPQDSIQSTVATVKDPTISLRKIVMEHPDRNSSMVTFKTPSTFEQQHVESTKKHDAEHSQFAVSADLAASLDSANEPAVQHESHISEAAHHGNVNVSSPEANALSLEAASVALQGLNEAQVDATIKVQDQDGGTVTGVGKETDAFPVSESVSKGAVKEPTADSVIQTPSSASSIAEDPQLTTVKTAQEITLAELKAKRAALMASLAPLPVVRDLLATSGASSQGSNAEPTEGEILTAAHQINKKHIKLLHEYNEIKDVGQGLMGLIADQRGVRIVDVQDDFGVDAKD
jgi:hypothetical protein